MICETVFRVQNHILTVCTEFHPTGKGLSYYLYWKKSNFHSRPININLSLDKKICLLHSNYKPVDSLCPVHTCKVFHNIRTASQGFALSPLSSTRTDLSSVYLVRFQGNAGTNIHRISHTLTKEHTQAGVRNMKWFSAANCEIHLNRLFSQLCDRRQYLGPDEAAHLKKKKIKP